MRRPLVLLIAGGAVVLVGLGVLGWYLAAGSGPSAADLVDQACGHLEQGVARGPAGAGRAALDAAVASSSHAARLDQHDAPFATATGRVHTAVALGGPDPAGLVADVHAVDQACRHRFVRGVVATRRPYLTDVTPTEVTVSFALEQVPPNAPTVEYGPVGSRCNALRTVATRVAVVKVRDTDEYQYRADLGGLHPDTRYCYRLGTAVFDAYGGGSFVSAIAPGDPTPYSFAVIGDWGQGSPDEAAILGQIARSPARFIVTVGDNAYVSGNQTDYGDLDGGNVFAPGYWTRVAQLPAFLAQGNHGFTNYTSLLEDWPESSVVRSSGGSYQKAQYCCIATLPKPTNYADAWYAFDYGGARFYVLEGAWADHTGDYQGDFLGHWNGPVPGCGPCGAERAWLEADLAAHRDTPVKFAFWHYPVHVDATDHVSDPFLAGPGGLEGLLARDGVGIVFNGHAHLYERATPQIPGSPMVSYITGGGGGELASLKGCDPWVAYARALDTACNAPVPAAPSQVFEYLLVTVDGHRVTVTPTGEDGSTFDVQTYTFTS